MLLTVIHTTSSEDTFNCQQEIDNISTWTTNNRIKLNETKTARMLLNKGGFTPEWTRHTTIEESQSLVILGMQLTNDFSWTLHITNTIRKCSKNLYLLRVLKPVLPTKSLISLFLALIQSHFDYGSQAYVGSIKANDRKRITKTMKRAHRIICGPNCINQCLPDPDKRRFQLAEKLYSAALNNDQHVLHTKMPRFLPSGRRLNISHSTSSRRTKSFIPFMTVHYNSSSTH